EGSVEEREYQLKIAEEAARQNTIVVLPTGLGKTIIGCFVIAKRLDSVGGRALVLAPTRPLVEQHANALRKFLTLGSASCLTGQLSKKKRASLWSVSRIVVSTPQVAVNDMRSNLLPDNISVVIFDEAHRAVGDYAYVPLAKGLRKLNPNILILGLTASPGHELERVEEVTKNLGITNIIMRTREDPEVAPYVKDVSIQWIEVPPSEVITKISKSITKYYHERLNTLRRYGFLRNRKNSQVRIQDLNEVKGKIFARMKGKGGGPYLFQASRQASLARMANHAILCVERQGVHSLLKFLVPKTKEGRSKIDASFINDKRIKAALNRARTWKGASHPKVEPLVEVRR
ncbi:MAG: DEAD/DEAH box helicase, partial [Thermoplasmata archaeon]